MGPRTQRIKRAVHVGRVARRGGLLRVLRELGVWGNRPATREGAREFRHSLEELGTTYIKLGQLLSSRPDLLPDVYIEELGKLVDEVPPVPFDQIREVIAAELPPDTFVRVDAEPLATASIAQIHSALLASGREVIVKVRRPGIEHQIDVDLALMRSTAELLESHSERAQLLQARALADELEVHLRGELDFVEEANNAELVARLVSEYEDLVVPAVIRPYVTERVLVLERIAGRKVDADHGLSTERARELARQFFRAYVHQVTVEGVYHADPHRGNVLLTTDGRLALVDFGLLGRLDDDTRHRLALLLLAVAQNRADDVADLILGLSRVTLGSNEPGFVQELRRKLPRYHWRPLSAIRAGEALADLQRISFEYGISLPTTFALVGKTLAQADSIARVLYPELDPIELMEEDALEVMLGGRAPARAEPAVCVAVHAARTARPNAEPHRPSRQQARDGDVQGRRCPHGSRRFRTRNALGREPRRRGGDRRRAVARVRGARAGSRSPLGRLRALLRRIRLRALHALGDHPHPWRALGADLAAPHRGARELCSCGRLNPKVGDAAFELSKAARSSYPGVRPRRAECARMGSNAAAAVRSPRSPPAGSSPPSARGSSPSSACRRSPG
jgi:predicted unusual protein kinase regulating ubiquinone biosynthesis (AarF/ABC1/UbiB family)